MALKLLIVGDERKNRRMLNWGLPSDSYEIQTASTRSAVSSLLEQQGFHLACVDARLQDDDAVSIVGLIRQRQPRLPVIALLPDRDRRLMAELKDLGVQAHLFGPFTFEALRSTVDREASRDLVGGAAKPAVPAPSAPASL